jgi:hypothetical protein
LVVRGSVIAHLWPQVIVGRSTNANLQRYPADRQSVRRNVCHTELTELLRNRSLKPNARWHVHLERSVQSLDLTLRSFLSDQLGAIMDRTSPAVTLYIVSATAAEAEQVEIRH